MPEFTTVLVNTAEALVLKEPEIISLRKRNKNFVTIITINSKSFKMIYARIKKISL